MTWGEPEDFPMFDAPMHWCDTCQRYSLDPAAHDERGCSDES